MRGTVVCFQGRIERVLPPEVVAYRETELPWGEHCIPRDFRVHQPRRRRSQIQVKASLTPELLSRKIEKNRLNALTFGATLQTTAYRQ